MQSLEAEGVAVDEATHADTAGAHAGTSAETAAWRQAARRATIMFLAGWGTVGLGVLSWATMGHAYDDRPVVCLFGAATALFSFSVIRAIGALRLIFASGWPLPGWRVLQLCVFPLAGGTVMMLGGFGMVSTFIFPRGRQLRRLGQPVLPATVTGAEPTEPATALALPEDLRHAVGAAWRENAQTEHASIAAFAKLTLQLIALGAPSRLVEAAQRDGADETRHARLCFVLANSIDGLALGPGPFPAAARSARLVGGRTWALCALAIDSLVDGALYEGVSARVMSGLAPACDDAKVRAVLERLASDEARHAEHGWEVVEWCVAEGGRPVMAALCGALAVLPDHLQAKAPEAAASGSWQRFGIPGAAMQREEYVLAKRMLTARTMALAAVAGRSPGLEPVGA